MKIYINFKAKKKVIAFIWTMVFAISCLSFQSVYGDNVNSPIISTYSSEIKPQININYLGSTPESPMVGQDFTVRYEIDPLPFYHNTSGSKEIVLVLDKSGSMDKDNKMGNLKKAATAFIDSLTVANKDGKTPKITNLKIGIVAFSNHGAISSDLLEVTSEATINDRNKSLLKDIINDLTANGGTNTGDGLRKGAYLLDKANPVANKTLIFMADGEPTYYSYYYDKWSKEYYTKLDNTNPSRGGTGSGDSSGKCLEYSTTIGNIIRNKKYNVFSIGYGLGSSDSVQNTKMKKIHESMGGISSGEKSTFFATDSGAIDVVFKSIADTLISSYTIGEVELNLDLGGNLIAIDGFEISDGLGGKISIEPIIYNKNDNNQYIAEKQIIEITLRAEADGNLDILKDSSFFKYKDIDGNIQNITISNNTLNIRPFSIEEAEKLDVDFKCIPEGYLIGDVITGKVTFTHNGKKEIAYKDATFSLSDDNPSNLTLTNGADSTLDFGTITSTVNRDYNLKINDDPRITLDSEMEYVLKGNYTYNLVKANNTEVQSGIKEAKLRVKRGLIKVKIFDQDGNDITEMSSLSITAKNMGKIYSTLKDGYAIFDTVSSGNYIVGIEDLPKGCYVEENTSSTVLRVDHNNNIAEVTFKVKGVVQGNSKIISHGIYLNSNVSKMEKMLLESTDKSINLNKPTPITVGILLEVSGSSNLINISKTNGKINFSDVKVYEITGNNLANIVPKKVIEGQIELGAISSGKCLIIYTYEPDSWSSSATVNASIVNTSSEKALKINFSNEGFLNLF